MNKLIKSDAERIKKLRSKGLSWNEIARWMHRSHHTICDTAKAAGIHGDNRRRPRKISDRRVIENVNVVLPDSPLERIENLLIFDARCLDRATQQELLRLLPQLVHIRRAWKALYLECGCISCHRKRNDYASGGFCSGCQSLITARMRNRHRLAMAGRDLTAEIEKFTDGLALRFNAAQRLFGGEE